MVDFYEFHGENFSKFIKKKCLKEPFANILESDEKLK